jgi:hypothetical protein
MDDASDSWECWRVTLENSLREGVKGSAEGGRTDGLALRLPVEAPYVSSIQDQSVIPVRGGPSSYDRRPDDTRRLLVSKREYVLGGYGRSSDDEWGVDGVVAHATG